MAKSSVRFTVSRFILKMEFERTRLQSFEFTIKKRRLLSGFAISASFCRYLVQRLSLPRKLSFVRPYEGKRFFQGGCFCHGFSNPRCKETSPFCGLHYRERF